MVKSKETVLYYNPNPGDNTKRLKGVLVQMGVRIRSISPEQTGQQVGYLAGMAGFEENGSGDIPFIEKEILIMKDFTGNRIDELLINLRRSGVPHIALKAVLTESNSKWTFYDLYQELRKEHESFQKNHSTTS